MSVMAVEKLDTTEGIVRCRKRNRSHTFQEKETAKGLQEETIRSPRHLWTVGSPKEEAERVTEEDTDKEKEDNSEQGPKRRESMQ